MTAHGANQIWSQTKGPPSCRICRFIYSVFFFLVFEGKKGVKRIIWIKVRSGVQEEDWSPLMAAATGVSGHPRKESCTSLTKPCFFAVFIQFVNNIVRQSLQTL